MSAFDLAARLSATQFAPAIRAAGSSNPRGGSRGDADGGSASKYPTDTETKNG